MVSTISSSSKTKYIGKYFNSKKDSVDIESIKKSIQNQVHYYFSIENLCRDVYLRCNMDNDGWVSINFISNFNRMRSYDISNIVNSLESSEYLQLNESLNKVRLVAEDMRKLWILPEEVKNGFLSGLLNKEQQDEENNGTNANINASGEGWITVKSKKLTRSENILSSKDSSNDDQMIIEDDGQDNEQYKTEEGFFDLSDDDHQDFFAKERRNFDYRERPDHTVNQKDQEMIKEDEGEQFEVQQEDQKFVGSYSEKSEDNFYNEYDDQEDISEGDDEKDISNQLIIITQSPYKKNKINSKKYITSEIASIINDGLYFYEQDLKRNKQNKFEKFNTIVNSKSSSSSTKPSVGNQKELSSNTVSNSLVNDLKSPTRLYSPKPKNTSSNESSTPVGWVMAPVNNSESSTPSGSPTSTLSNNNNNSVAVPTFASVISSTITQSKPIVPSSSSTETPSSKLNDKESNKKQQQQQSPFPYFQHPSYELLEENGFVLSKYNKYKNNCLKERSKLGIGHSTEMNTLFRFWTHFLRTRFNNKIYQEFKQVSIEDSKQNYRYGLECLFRFYSYGLEKKIRLDILQDFQDLTLLDYKENKQVYGLEKFWAFLKYRKDKSPIDVDPELKEILSKFNSLEDFKNFERINKPIVSMNKLSSSSSTSSFLETDKLSSSVPSSSNQSSSKMSSSVPSSSSSSSKFVSNSSISFSRSRKSSSPSTSGSSSTKMNWNTKLTTGFNTTNGSTQSNEGRKVGGQSSSGSYKVKNGFM